jgi:hypothetical protein
VTLGGPLHSPRDLYNTARDLLGAVDLARPVRLLGLGGSGLEESNEPRQLDLGTDENWVRVSDAVAEVRERFGDRSVEPARLVTRKEQYPESDR